LELILKEEINDKERMLKIFDFDEKENKWVTSPKKLLRFDSIERFSEELNDMFRQLFKNNSVISMSGYSPTVLDELWTERDKIRRGYLNITLDSTLELPKENPVISNIKFPSSYVSGNRISPWFFDDAVKFLADADFKVTITEGERTKIEQTIRKFKEVKVEVVDVPTYVKDSKGVKREMQSIRLRLTVSDQVPEKIRNVTKFGNLKFFEFDVDSFEKVETVLRLITEKQDYEKKVYYYQCPYCAFPAVRKWYESKGLKIIGESSKPTPLPFFMSSNIEKFFKDKWSFQLDAFDNWFEANGFGTIIIPTGGGKSFVAFKAIKEINTSTLILVITKELMFQWRDWLVEHLKIPEEQIGLFYARKKEIKPITIAIYDSAQKYIGRLKKRFNFVIADECHHVPARTFRIIMLESTAQIRMSLSATAWRYDGNSPLIFFAGGDPCYEISYDELINMKVVAPIIHNKIYTNLTKFELQEYTRVSNKPAFHPGMRMKNIAERRRLAYTSENKIPAIIGLVEKHKGEKVLIFCYYLHQVHQIDKALHEAMITHGVITGQTKSSERRDLFEEFKNGALNVVVTTTVLDEGIDVPDASVAIVASGYGSPRQFVQRTGRVVRYQQNKIAYLYEIISSGTTEVDASERRNETSAFKKQQSTILRTFELGDEKELVKRLDKALTIEKVEIPEWRLIYAHYCQRGRSYSIADSLYYYQQWTDYKRSINYSRYYSILSGRLVRMRLVKKETRYYENRYEPIVAYWKEQESFKDKKTALKVLQVIKTHYPEVGRGRWSSDKKRHNIIVMRAVMHELGFSPVVIDKALCTLYPFTKNSVALTLKMNGETKDA